MRLRRTQSRPLPGTPGIGVKAFSVEEEDAGAQGEEHDGETGGDAEMTLCGEDARGMEGRPDV